MKNLKTQKGFTLVELLITLIIVGTAAGVGTVSFVSFNERQIVEQAAQNFISNMRITQQRALSGEKDTEICGTKTLQGWCFTPSGQNEGDTDFNKYQAYGTCASVLAAPPPDTAAFPIESQQQVNDLPDSVTINSFILFPSTPGAGFQQAGGRILFEAGSNHVYIRATNPSSSNPPPPANPSNIEDGTEIRYCFNSNLPSLSNFGNDTMYLVRVTEDGTIQSEGFVTNCPE